MENLDDFMRQKFNTDPDTSGDRFEFREEYWEQAQALLEAEEKRRRKRRRWLLWWIFAIAVGVGGWQIAVAIGGSRKSNGQEQSVQERSVLDTSETRNSEEATDMHTQDTKVADSEYSGGATNGSDSVILKNKIENQNPGIHDGTIEKAGRPKQQSEKSGIRQNTRQESAVRAPSSPTHRNAAETSAKTLPNTPEVEINKDAMPPHSGDVLPVQTNETKDLSGNPADSIKDLDIAPVATLGFNNFDLLPVLPGLLDLPVRDPDLPSVVAAAQKIEPVRSRKFTFGLEATGTLGSTSPDGKSWGATGGAFARYRLTPVWSISTGANWRYLAGAWVEYSTLTTSEQLRYDFGYQRDIWMLETHGLHFIEIPIGLRWQRGNLSAEGGFALGFLLGVQGTKVQQHSESLLSEATVQRSRVWLSKSPYHQFSPAVYLGGEWQAFPWLGVTLRGTFRPGKIGENLTDAPSPANLFWLDAGLRWYF